MNYYLITYKGSADLKFPGEYTKVVGADNPKDASEEIDRGMVITSIKTISNPETNYTVLKNHIHNTLEITKTDLRKMVEEAIEDIVERKLDVYLEYNSGIERIIDSAIREKAYSSLMWGNSHNLDEEIQKKIVAEVTKKLIKEIGLEVTLKKK